MRSLFVCIAGAAAVAAVMAAGTSAHVRPAAAARCVSGVSDRMAGRTVCIHVGGRCLASHNGKYRARGFTCVNGRLRRVKKVTISVGDASTAEGNSGTRSLSVPVSLSVVSRSIVVVDYSTADGTALAGSDYASARGTLTFRPAETQKVIPIAVLGDTSIERDETLLVILSSPANATIARGEATATIANDDTAVSVAAGSYQGATQ